MQSVIENTDLPTPLQQRCAWQTIIIELTDMKDHVMSGRGCVQVPLYLHFQSGGCIWNQHFFALLEVCINSKKWLTACLERQHFKRQWISLTMLSVFQHWQETEGHCWWYYFILHTYCLFNLLLTPNMVIAFAKCWRSRTPCSFYRHCSTVLILLHAHRGGCWFVICIVNLSILQWIVALSHWNEKIIKLMSMFISKKE